MLLSHIIRLHYNYKYVFLRPRPTMKEVVARYNAKFRPNVAKQLAATAAVGFTSGAAK